MDSSAQDTEAEWLAAYHQITRSLPLPAQLVNTDLSQAARIWDSEINNVYKILALASTRRNECAHVNRLPTELLSLVFQFLAEIQPRQKIGWNFERQGAGWSTAMLVCSHWRTVALRTASLWATVALDGREPLDIFLERSKQFPLTVTGFMDIDGSRDMFNLRARQLLDPVHLSRLETLDIRISFDREHAVYREHTTSPDDAVAVLLSAPGAHAPKLKYVKIVYSQDFAPGICLPPMFTASLAPNIVSIYLIQRDFPWGTSFSALRHLHLYRYCAESDPYPYTLDNIMESLEAMSNLETLETHYSLPNVPMNWAQFIDSHKAISLPSLTHLMLWESSIDSCWILWALLQINPNATIDIDAQNTSSATPVATALSAHFRRPENPRFRRLSMCQTEGEHSDSASRYPFQFYLDIPTDSSTARMRLAMQLEDLRSLLLLQILVAIPLEAVTNLDIHGPYFDFFLDDVAEFFTNAPCLRRIDVTGTMPADAFIPLLFSPTATSFMGAPIETAGFSHLDEFRIRRADLTGSHVRERGKTAPLGEYLSRAMESRNGPHVLQYLKVAKCKVQEDWVHTWRKHVHDVDWDGEVDGIVSDSDSDED